MKKFWEVLFGKRTKNAEPVFEYVSTGWVARVVFSRAENGYSYTRERTFWSTLHPNKVLAEKQMNTWAGLAQGLAAHTREVLPLERVTEDGAKYYMTLTKDDALRGIRVDVHEVIEKKEVKDDKDQ